MLGWLSRERMYDLLRHLWHANYLASDISKWTVRDLSDWLNQPRWQRIDAWGAGGVTISRHELHQAMSCINENGYANLPFEEMAISPPGTRAETERALRQLFDAVVETYRSCCEAWFPRAAAHFVYAFGPFRFVACPNAHNITYWLEPVPEWGTPCELRSAAPSGTQPSFEDHAREIEEKALELGREPLRSIHTSFQILSDWHAPVTRHVRAMLKRDLETVEHWLHLAT